MAHGFKIEIPSNLYRAKPTYNYDNLADFTRNHIQKALEFAKENLINRNTKNKQNYDKNCNPCEIKIDDLVLIKNQVKKHKFDNLYDGPYKVTDTHDSYIEILKNGKKTKIHKNFVKKSKINKNKYAHTFQQIGLNNLDEKTMKSLINTYSIKFDCINPCLE